MNDETWIQELAQAAKAEAEAERTELEGPWGRLSAGELSAEEAEALARLGETSEEAKEAYEAFRPLSPEFKARTMAAVRERLKAGGDAGAPIEPVESASSGDAVAPAAPLPFALRPAPTEHRARRSLARRWGGWVATAAAAAALFLFLRAPGGTGAPLPDYQASLEGGVVTHRGSEERSSSELHTFRQGGRLDLALTPSTRVEGEVEARCVLLRGHELRPCDRNVKLLEKGVVQVAGTIGEDLRLEPGEWTLCAAVGRPRDLPNGEAVCGKPEGDRRPARGWRSWKYDLRIEQGGM